MQGWSFLPHPHSTHVFGLCRKEMDLGKWQQIIISFIRCWSKGSCSSRCGFVAEANQYIPWHLICSYRFYECFFFSIPVSKDCWPGKQYNLIVPPQEYINSPVLCHNLVIGDLDHFSLPYHAPLHWWYYDDGPCEQEILITLDTLRHPCARR